MVFYSFERCSCSSRAGAWVRRAREGAVGKIMPKLAGRMGQWRAIRRQFISAIRKVLRITELHRGSESHETQISAIRQWDSGPHEKVHIHILFWFSR